MYNETQMQIALTNLCDDISKHIEEIDKSIKGKVNKVASANDGNVEWQKGVKFGLNDCRKELRKIIDESW